MEHHHHHRHDHPSMHQPQHTSAARARSQLSRSQLTATRPVVAGAAHAAAAAALPRPTSRVSALHFHARLAHSSSEVVFGSAQAPELFGSSLPATSGLPPGITTNRPTSDGDAAVSGGIITPHDPALTFHSGPIVKRTPPPFDFGCSWEEEGEREGDQEGRGHGHDPDSYSREQDSEWSRYLRGSSCHGGEALGLSGYVGTAPRSSPAASTYRVEPPFVAQVSVSSFFTTVGFRCSVCWLFCCLSGLHTLGCSPQLRSQLKTHSHTTTQYSPIRPATALHCRSAQAVTQAP